MKTKFASVLALTAIILGTASISQAQASPKPPVNMQSIQNIPEMNFTEEQKAKLKEVQAEVSSRMNDILTSQQQAYLKAAVDSGRNPQEVIKSLNLSRPQKQQLDDVQKWQRNQLFSILTNEQKQKLMNIIQKQGGRRPF